VSGSHNACDNPVSAAHTCSPTRRSAEAANTPIGGGVVPVERGTPDEDERHLGMLKVTACTYALVLVNTLRTWKPLA
jgi:hypothetical protein